jgi:DNA polymerase-3 subunit beta
MQLDRKTLSSVLSDIRSVITDTVPVFYLAASDGVLTIAGTNMEIYAAAELGVDDTLPPICVDAGLLFNAVRSVPTDTVTLTAEEKLTVKGGRSRYQLAYLDGTRFPQFAPPPELEWIEVDGAVLSAALKRVRYAVLPGDIAKPYFGGTYLHSIDGALRVTTANGPCLAVVDIIPYTGPAVGVIIPPKFCDLVSKFEGAVRLGVAQSGIVAECGGYTVRSKVIDSEFPPYWNILNSVRGTGSVVEIDAGELRQALQRVTAVCDEKVRTARLMFSDGRCVIRATTADGISEAVDEVEYNGGSGEVVVTTKYLLDTLSAVGDCVVNMSIDGAKPMRFWGVVGEFVMLPRLG